MDTKMIARCDGGNCGMPYCCYECPKKENCRSDIKCDGYSSAEESEECEHRIPVKEHFYKVEVVEKHYATILIKAKDEEEARERAYNYEYDDSDFSEDETVLEVWDVEKADEDVEEADEKEEAP